MKVLILYTLVLSALARELPRSNLRSLQGPVTDDHVPYGPGVGAPPGHVVNTIPLGGPPPPGAKGTPPPVKATTSTIVKGTSAPLATATVPPVAKATSSPVAKATPKPVSAATTPPATVATAPTAAKATPLAKVNTVLSPAPTVASVTNLNGFLVTPSSAPVKSVVAPKVQPTSGNHTPSGNHTLNTVPPIDSLAPTLAHTLAPTKAIVTKLSGFGVTASVPTSVAGGASHVPTVGKNTVHPIDTRAPTSTNTTAKYQAASTSLANGQAASIVPTATQLDTLTPAVSDAPSSVPSKTGHKAGVLKSDAPSMVPSDTPSMVPSEAPSTGKLSSIVRSKSTSDAPSTLRRSAYPTTTPH
jgi:hypothetical protein